MRKLTIIILLFATTVSASLFINSFNSGQLGKDLKSRHDLDRTSMGSEELENILIRPQGMAFKRPGTEFIDTEIAEYGIQIIVTPEVLGDYPTLRATTDQADPGLTHTLAISNVTELQAMNNDKTGNYYLTSDIDASATSTWNGGAGFAPIGPYTNDFQLADRFTGTFDGCGYTISDLYINLGTGWNSSLFGCVSSPAKIANVTLENVNIIGDNYYTGALVSQVRTYDAGGDVLIQNCHSSGTITSYDGGMGYFGGLIGSVGIKAGNSTSRTYVYDSSSSCTLDMSNATAYSARGGFLGNGQFAIISNCFATGSLTGGDYGDSSIGGFVGNIVQSDLTFCYATGSIEGGGSYCGGFAGTVSILVNFDSCSATGSIDTSTISGGFAGIVSSDGSNACIFTDCYAWGDVTTPSVVGGFVGSSDDSNTTYTNCYSVGLVTGNTDIGGFGGNVHVSTNWSDCYWDTETSGNATTDQNIGTGHTTLWMKTKSNFTDAGWDMDTIWYQAYTAINYGDLGGGGGNVRLIPFEFSVSEAYVIEMGHNYLSFFRTVP